MIRLVLVDDQALIRAGIRGLLDLTPDIRVVAEAADGEAAVQVITEAAPDVVLLDVRMPRLSGIGVVEELTRRGVLPPILLLTTFDDDQALLEGMRAGARGFLLKDVSLEQLTDAIRRVAAGDVLFQPAATRERVTASAAGAGVPPARDGGYQESLTRREREVLGLLATGWNNREIAVALHLNEGTVKNHVSNILAKLGVRDRTRAVLKAMQQGLLP
ncbi:MAG: DNA-binding response regulator [Desulfobulbaceae bacterium A2]|nr:MAG: DNA-binding response regulator [Desulfobulbaceae bacterium A2]